MKASRRLVAFALLSIVILSFQNCAQFSGSIFDNRTPDNEAQANPENPNAPAASLDPKVRLNPNKENCFPSSDGIEDALNYVPPMDISSMPPEFTDTAYGERASEADAAVSELSFGFNIPGSSIKSIMLYPGNLPVVCVTTTGNMLSCKGGYYSSELPLAASKSQVQKVADNVAESSITTQRTCVVNTNNELRCTNNMTDSTVQGSRTPSVIVSDVKSIKTSTEHSCYLKTNGDLHCYGKNSSGQIGNNATSNDEVAIANAFLALTNVRLFAVAPKSTCAVTLTNELYCWGNVTWITSSANGTPVIQASPKLYKSDFNVSQIEPTRATENGYCYIQGTTLDCFGGTINGVVGGTIDAPHRITTDAKRFISANGFNFCYISTTDQARCMTLNPSSGQLAEGFAPAYTFRNSMNSIKDVYMGNAMTCYHLQNNQIRCAGYAPLLHEYFGNATTPVKTASNVANMDLDHNSLCVRHTDGQMECWGQGKGPWWYPKMPRGDARYNISRRDFNGIKAKEFITSNKYNFCKISDNGELVCWGSVMSHLQKTKNMSLSACHISTLVKPTKKVATTQGYVCAVNVDNEINCFGSLKYEFDLPNDSNILKIDSIGDVVDIQAGYRHMCALNSNKDVYCFGQQSYFMSSTMASQTPVKISTGPVKQIAVRGVSTCLVYENGEAHCYGSGGAKKVADSDVVSFAHVDSTYCYADSDGKVWCKGYRNDDLFGSTIINSNSYTQIPMPISNPHIRSLSISDGGNLCVINSDDELYCQGANHHGVLGQRLYRNFPLKIAF